MDQVKEAFKKVKEDVYLLHSEFIDIKKELSEIQLSILQLIKENNQIIHNLSNFSTDNQTDRQSDRQTIRQTDKSTTFPELKTNSTHSSTEIAKNTSIRHINQTENGSSTHPSTDNYGFQSLKGSNTYISIGNRGVSTDRQTDRQTDTSTGNRGVSTHSSTDGEEGITRQSLQITPSNPSIILDQLDALKKEVRLKFKRLTPQEMLVFSSIYQFEDQGHLVDYSFLSSKLNISESSIRDYIQRLINKGITLDKEKINNKKIVLHISPDLRKLATLDTLMSLREL